MFKMKEDIKKILETAVWAPSGDNSQPWRFEVKNNVIYVLNLPEKDTSLYNFNQNANHIAIGALIENIIITTTHFGYQGEIKTFPKKEDPNLVAEIALDKSNVEEDRLCPYITSRSTNRRPYKKLPIPDEVKEEFIKESKKFLDTEIQFVDSENAKKEIARAASLNEKIVLEDKRMHNFLFSHITWTEEEDKDKKGFFIKTLELKKPQLLAFKFISSWGRLRILRRFIPISDFVAKENSKTYAQSSSFLVITSNVVDKEGWINAGRCLQRIWLVATKNDISVQPLIGFVLLANRVRLEDKTALLEGHGSLVTEEYSNMKNILKTENEILSMLRIGYSDKPSARTLREEPEIKFL